MMLREEIARALCAKDGGLRSCEDDSRCIDGDMCPYPALADAALAAIEASGTHVVVPLEPTEEMLKAGRECEPFDYTHTAPGFIWTPGQIVASTCYREMIAARPRDAAPTEEKSK